MKENEKEGGGERDVGRTGERGEKGRQRRERLGEGKRRERQREEGRNLPNQEHAILVSLVLYQVENDASFRRIENLSLMNSSGRKIWREGPVRFLLGHISEYQRPKTRTRNVYLLMLCQGQNTEKRMGLIFIEYLLCNETLYVILLIALKNSLQNELSTSYRCRY